MNNGCLNLVLHAHLPYIRHPEYDNFFEERWLFEAITECYIPLAIMLDRLHEEKVNYRLTLSLSPTLITLLQDELLTARYLRHLESLQELAALEVERTRQQPDYHLLALFYQQLFNETYRYYVEQIRRDLLAVFKRHHQSGHLELITTAATHGFLPLLNTNPVAVKTQIKTGLETFETFFGFSPDGFWLPECAFYPGLESVLAQANIHYFFVDTHALQNARNFAVHDVYTPADCGNGVFAFARDPHASEQVWSSTVGYPADPVYREFYSDIGHELDVDYLAPFLLDRKTRINTGIKYHRIDHSCKEKQPYQPEIAAERARQHAADFVQKRSLMFRDVRELLPQSPIFVAPYDAELFGHWWFEGPIWLEQVLRLTAQDDGDIELMTAKEYLSRHRQPQVTMPIASSWGEQGYSAYWLNESNDWVYPLIHKAADDLEKLVSDVSHLTLSPLQERALNQALRSVLLMQASDWTFLMKAGTAGDYANKRISDQVARFNFLHDSIRKNRIDERYLTALEIMDDIFPDIDFRCFR